MWLKSGCKHFTFVRMDLKKDEAQEVAAVEVLLADSNWDSKTGSKTPALDREYLDNMQTVSAQLFPGAAFREGTGVKVPQQATMDCAFHTGLYLVNTISGHKMDESPPSRFWPVYAGRLRSYFLCIVYKEMRSKGANLPELREAHGAWFQQRFLSPSHAGPAKRALEEGQATELASRSKQARAGANAHLGVRPRG